MRHDDLRKLWGGCDWSNWIQDEKHAGWEKKKNEYEFFRVVFVFIANIIPN